MLIVKSAVARIVCVGLFSLMLTCIGFAKIDQSAIVGMWLFNEDKGDVAKDSSGNGHDGEIKGDVKWVEGQFDNALEFPGTDGNYVTVPHEDSLTLTTFTIAAWVKQQAPAAGVWPTVVSKNGETYNYYFQASDTGLFTTGFTVGGAWCEVSGTTNLFDEKWHHLAGTYDKKSLRVYVDGTLEGEASHKETPDENSEPMGIGGFSDGTTCVVGIVDEVVIVNSALTEDDIRSIMTKGLKSVSAVSPSSKLATAWGRIKQY